MKKKLDPVTPGEILLEEFMLPFGISQNKLARDIDVPVARINDIVAALTGMGFDRRLATQVATEAFEELKNSTGGDEAREREILRLSIQKASRGAT